MLLNPERKEITDKNGETKTFILGDIPYMSGGREVCSQFITTGAPKLGDYKANEALARIIYKHVAVVLEDGTEQILSTDALINNHVSFDVGVKIELAMLEKTAGFSIAGKIREYQQRWLETLPATVSKMATALAALLSPKK